jgi:lysosomal alpha-mannosidase
MQNVVKIFLFVVASIWMQSIKVIGDKCSYENCLESKADMLNVHFVCHSHDDAGWLKTVDQYFWGSNQSISKDGVQYVIDSVTGELQHDPGKRFSFAEAGFFWRWMLIQDDMTRHQVMKLVKNGQLEFTGGGWVQHDEATSHYSAIIDQMTIGHRFLNQTFGKCGVPRTAWQIDPFGHSRETASLFAQMGLEGLFFARLHYADRDKRIKEKNMETLWRGSDDLGKASEIFTHAFYEHYMPPPGFCFDEGCDDQPIMDDRRLEGYNVDERVDAFIAYVKKQAQAYQTNHILLTMGGDFQYMNAGRVFANLDKLIKYVNRRQTKGSKIHALYSTPACYTKAVKEAGIKLSTKTDDFFPYANDVHSYWTGYFTSRPALKGAIRQASNVLQACQSMDAIGGLGPADFGDVDVLHRALGILQHHDAVSGTAKQHVTNDYVKMLHEGLLECQQVLNDALSKLAPKKSGGQVPPYQTFCFNMNASVCNVSQAENHFIVTLYNGMSQPLNTFLRLPVAGASYAVFDPLGQPVSPQITKTFATKQISAVQGPYDLIFPITLPGVGYSTYYVTRQSSASRHVLCQGAGDDDKEYILRTYGVDCDAPPAGAIPRRSAEGAARPNDATLSNNLISVQFDANTGLVKSVKDVTIGHILSLKQNFYWYKGAIRAGEGKQASGAYIFRPNGTKPFEVTSGPVTSQKIEGALVQEMRQTFSPWLSQTVRLYTDKPYVEFEWTVGPIPYEDRIAKEVISRFDTTLKNDKVFWTDANGRQMVKRTRNYQPTYDYNNTEPIAGNYYPVNSRISIQDSSIQMTILTDRSQGGSSLADGSIELMVHRRCFEDDGFGVEEALNETGIDGRGLVVRGKHWVLLSEPSKAAKLHRQYAMEMFYQPISTFAPVTGTFDEYKNQFNTIITGIKSAVPQNVNFLTVAQWQAATSILLRLEHLYQKDEDSELSKPVSLSIKNHLAAFELLALEEMTLSANALVNQSTNYRSITDDQITLQPMQIRTFRCTVKNKMTSKRNTIRTRFLQFPNVRQIVEDANEDGDGGRFVL